MKGKFKYPVEKNSGNLLLTEQKEVVALYKVQSLSVAIIDEKKKREIKESVGRILRKFAPHKDFEIALVPKDFRLTEKARDMSTALADEAKEMGEYVLNHMVQTLTNEMEIVYNYEWIVSVWLKQQQVALNPKEGVKRKVNEVVTKVVNGLGYEYEDDESWKTEYSAEEAELYQILSPVRAKRLTDEETFYYQRYQFLRHTKHEFGEVVANRHIFNVTDSVIENAGEGVLRLKTPYGDSYMCVLPVGKSPVTCNFQYIAEKITRMNYPVEMRIKAEFAEINGVSGLKGQMVRSRVRSRNIMNEASSSGSTQQDRIIDGMNSLVDLEKKIGNKEPIITYGMYLIISASTKERLERRRALTLTSFENAKIEVSRASFDQPYLFQNTLLGVKLNMITKRWQHVVTAKGLSEQMLFATTSAGTNTGFYLGRIDTKVGKWDSLAEAVTGSRNVVLLNQTLANKEGIAGKASKNPHMLITGATGYGKSYLAQKLFIQATLLDLKTLYVDPKKVIRGYYTECINNPIFRKKYPLLVRHLETFNYVTLDAKDKRNHGVLDPIVVLEPIDAIETAKNMITYLSRAVDTSIVQRTAISKAVKKVVGARSRGEKVGLKHVVKILRNSSEKTVSTFGEYLFEEIDGSILDLAFSDGKVKGLSYEERVTVLEISNLKLPDSGIENISDHERNSVALMFALGSFCMRFGEMNPDEDTIEFFDEAWVLMKSTEGKRVVKSMRRVGRSMNNMLCVITQSVNDLDEDDDTTGFGTKFAFYEENEREDILKHMHLGTSKGELRWLDDMIAGQCLFKDTSGNLNRITIHELMPGLHELFSPMKDTKSSVIENKYAG